MSSILEALRELEGSRTPATQAADDWADRPRTLRWAAAALVVVAVAGSGGAALYYYHHRGGHAAPSAAPEPTPPAVDALPPAAPAPPPPAAALDADPPRARVAASTPAAPVAAAAPERPAMRVASRPRPPADDAAARPPRPEGEPRVAVTSIAYTSRAEDRAAVLSIDGGRPVTLHEGESAGGIEVQLIQRDGVYVRHAGQIFAVPAN